MGVTCKKLIIKISLKKTNITFITHDIVKSSLLIGFMCLSQLERMNQLKIWNKNTTENWNLPGEHGD